MDLELNDDQLALRDTARTVLARACPPTLVRRCFDGGDQAGDAIDPVGALWRTLVELDWPALGVPADFDGIGLGPVEVAVVVEEMGRVVAPGPFLATATHLVPLLREVAALPGPTPTGPVGDTLAAVARGERTGTLAVAEGGRWELEAMRTTAQRDGDGWVLDGTKSHVVDGATADEVAIVARGEAGIGVFLVAGGRSTATVPTVIDPTLPIAHLRLDGVHVEPDRVLVEPGDPRAADLVRRAVEEATVMLALSTVATCRAIFERTLAYAKEREQFGRPIGSFQALKHRLADCYLAVERATALCWYAVSAVAEDDAERTVATSMAKAVAGECQALLVRDGLQLHGGVGYTWEHDLHLELKRALTGSLLFGTTATHRARLAHLLGLTPAESTP